ncbi:MAG TPA: hypothetical protein VM680_05910 [Verrucomicrobiae bacterium]|nr:hypothetical protein [Verrucomicrobiae bacterium]
MKRFCLKKLAAQISPKISAVRKIRVAADYQCWPLWEASPGKYGDINPASLPISDALRADLLEWKSRFDSILNWDDPGSSGFADAAAEQEFKRMGAALAERLQQELGAGFEVILHR